MNQRRVDYRSGTEILEVGTWSDVCDVDATVFTPEFILAGSGLFREIVPVFINRDEERGWLKSLFRSSYPAASRYVRVFVDYRAALNYMQNPHFGRAISDDLRTGRSAIRMFLPKDISDVRLDMQISRPMRIDYSFELIARFSALVSILGIILRVDAQLIEFMESEFIEEVDAEGGKKGIAKGLNPEHLRNLWDTLNRSVSDGLTGWDVGKVCRFLMRFPGVPLSVFVDFEKDGSDVPWHKEFVGHVTEDVSVLAIPLLSYAEHVAKRE